MKGRVGPLLPNKPRGVLRVDDNNTLTPVVGCVRIAIQILRIL
jgi:hypothetical protein